MTTTIFFHAHPDDEAIFTGGTIARLADAGHRVLVVFATSGEMGLGAGPALAETRRTEARVSCALLGAERPLFLDHVDSGFSVAGAERPSGAFVDVRVDRAARQLATIADAEGADALVTYDRGGIYGHADHVHAHDVGRVAAAMAELPTWYESTVDREHLHFVDAHVAAEAGRQLSRDEAQEMPAVGLPTVEISTTIDVRAALARKIRAIGAHRSQVGPDPTFGAGDGFHEVYGLEWYVRHGRRAALDDLELVRPGPAGAAPPALRRAATGATA